MFIIITFLIVISVPKLYVFNWYKKYTSAGILSIGSYVRV